MSPALRLSRRRAIIDATLRGVPLPTSSVFSAGALALRLVGEEETPCLCGALCAHLFFAPHSASGCVSGGGKESDGRFGELSDGMFDGTLEGEAESGALSSCLGWLARAPVTEAPASSSLVSSAAPSAPPSAGHGATHSERSAGGAACSPVRARGMRDLAASEMDVVAHLASPIGINRRPPAAAAPGLAGRTCNMGMAVGRA